MPYQGGDRLPAQFASKTGHIDMIQSPLMQTLITRFEHGTGLAENGLAPWFHLDVDGVPPLGQVVASDGSLQRIVSEDDSRELCFVKTARFHLRTSDAADIDPRFPHPLQMRKLMEDAAIRCNAVFPLRNMLLREQKNIKHSIRELVREILTYEHQGLLYKTLKWLLYQGWGPNSPSPDFECPHCGKDAGPLPFDADEGRGRECGHKVYLTDVPGLHHDIGEESAGEALGSAYMALHETLLLVAHLYVHWRDGNFAEIEDTLLIKDGPLMFRGQYAKLTERLRAFLAYARSQGIAVHLIGQEKTGRMFDHLGDQTRLLRSVRQTEWPQVAILSHRYIRDRVLRIPDAMHLYGSRTNYGEKVLVRLDPSFALVINVPTGAFLNHQDRPSGPEDLMGLHRIIATLPHLVSYLHEGSLMPINLAHGIASLSEYPSEKALQRFAGLDIPPRNAA
jgi:hypothetical protein